jgi:hypothetical protein
MIGKRGGIHRWTVFWSGDPLLDEGGSVCVWLFLCGEECLLHLVLGVLKGSIQLGTLDAHSP